MKKLALVIGAIESVTIFLYGLSIVIRGTADHSTVGSPLAQFIIYSILASLLALCTRGISRQQSWARTPYFLGQIFVGIAGQLLFSGTFMIAKIIGIIVAVTGITGFVSLLRTPQEQLTSD